jgi:RimJ/RimL family protein N-acetyltransferase
MDMFLETDRLILRRLTAADSDNLFNLDSDPDVMRYLSGGAATPRDVIELKLLPRILGYYDRFPGFGYWAAIERASGDFLGWFSLLPDDGGSPENVELGYRLRKSAWGKGYATEGTRALVDKAFREFGVRRVFATTYQDNLASQRVMEKTGLTFVRSYRLTPEDLQAEVTFEADPQDIWDGDDVEYALEKSDWERFSPHAVENSIDR